MFSRGWLAAAAALIAVPACSSNDVGAGDVLVTSQVDIDPPGAGLRVGGTQQLTAIPRTSSGIAIPNRTVVWSSSNKAIATVSESGLVTAIAFGEAEIRAEIDQVTGTAPVSVTSRPVASVDVAPVSITLLVGQTAQLDVTVQDGDGIVLDNRRVTFVSDNSTVATVSSSGLITAIGPGETVVRARSEGKEGRATVTVTTRPAVRLHFITQPANGTAGQTLNEIRVAIQDDRGNTVTTATSEVRIELSDNPGGADLRGTRQADASNGIATFDDLNLTRAGSGYTLRATSGSLSPAISNPFNIAGPVSTEPDALVIVTQPSASAVVGRAFATQPVIQLKDQNGADLERAGIKVKVSLVGGGGKDLDGTKEVESDQDGRVRFDNLAIKKTGDFRLKFETGGVPAVESIVIRVRNDDDD